MSEVTDTLNAGELFEAAGKTWSLSHVTPGARAKFSAWAKLRARRELSALKGELTADEHREDLAALHASLAAGDYNWGSPLGADAMGPALRAVLGTAEGNAHLTGLLLLRAHGELAPAKVAEVMAAGGDLFVVALRAAMGLPAIEGGGEAPAPNPTPPERPGA